MAKKDDDTKSKNGDGTNGTGDGDGSDGVDYKSKFTGMQRAYNELSTKIADRDTTITELQAQIIELEAQLKRKGELATTLESSSAANAEKITEMTATTESLQAKVKRKDLVLTEFPGLAAFEGKGLLPQSENGTEEDLRKIFTTFNEALGDTTKTAVDDVLKGATPPPPAGSDETPAGDIDKWYDQAMNHAHDPQGEKYREAMAKIDELEGK